MVGMQASRRVRPRKKEAHITLLVSDEKRGDLQVLRATSLWVERERVYRDSVDVPVFVGRRIPREESGGDGKDGKDEGGYPSSEPFDGPVLVREEELPPPPLLFVEDDWVGLEDRPCCEPDLLPSLSPSHAGVVDTLGEEGSAGGRRRRVAVEEGWWEAVDR